MENYNEKLDFESINSSSEHLQEMANCRPTKTGLSMNIWIDETGAYKKGNLSKCINFQINKNPIFQTNLSCPMMLDGTIPKKIWNNVSNSNEFKLDSNDLDNLRTFVINNAYALDLIADQKVWLDDFWNFCIKDKREATVEQKIELQNRCNLVLHEN